MQEEQETAQQETQAPKKRRSLPTPAWIGILLVSVILTYAGTNFWVTGRLPWEVGSEQQALTNQNFRDFERTYRLLSENYFGEVKADDVVNQGIAGMARAVGDPYTGYFFGQDNARLQESVQGSFEGIGATVQEKGGEILIVSPVADSPAEKAGLQPKDVIVAIDGEKLDHATAGEAVAKIRGAVGTSVTLTIRRGEESFDVTLERAKIPIETVHEELLDGNIGRLQVTTFAQTTADELQKHVESLRKQGAERFILDLRGNPGGLLTSAVRIANMFLEDGDTILSVEDKDGHKLVYQADHQQYGTFTIDEPTVVLVDEGSASAAEIVAGALQQSAQLPVVGTQTFGKGTVQTVIPYDKEETRELKITTAHWLTPNGTWINETGLTPDHVAELPDYASLTIIDPSRNYEKGEHSAAVDNIQQILVALGYLDDEAVSGRFDEDTEAAVRTFQKDEGIDVDGVVNHDTAQRLTQALRELIASHDVQKEAAIEQVKQLQ